MISLHQKITITLSDISTKVASGTVDSLFSLIGKNAFDAIDADVRFFLSGALTYLGIQIHCTIIS